MATNSNPKPMLVPTPKCALCNDTGFTVETQNDYSCVKECVCKRERKVVARVSKVPWKYRGANLATLKPDLSRHPAQGVIIGIMQANPTASFLFAGRNDSGKSHFLWSLYAHAIPSSRRVVACGLKQLLDEYKAVFNDQTKERLVTVTGADLRQNHTPYSIFIDEIDKVRPTEYAAEQFFEVVDAAYSFGHQIVATTNLHRDELVDHWATECPQYGVSIVRRLVDDKHFVEMF